MWEHRSFGCSWRIRCDAGDESYYFANPTHRSLCNPYLVLCGYIYCSRPTVRKQDMASITARDRAGAIGIVTTADAGSALPKFEMLWVVRSIRIFHKNSPDAFIDKEPCHPYSAKLRTSLPSSLNPGIPDNDAEFRFQILRKSAEGRNEAIRKVWLQ